MKKIRTNFANGEPIFAGARNTTLLILVLNSSRYLACKNERTISPPVE